MNEFGDSIGIEILKTWGWPGIPLVLGLRFDGISANSFKEDIATRIRELGCLATCLPRFVFLMYSIKNSGKRATFVFVSS